MELRDRKYIKNSGKLPGFADGTLASQYGGWLLPAWLTMDWSGYANPAGKIAPVDAAGMANLGLLNLAASNQNALQSRVDLALNTTKPISTPELKTVAKGTSAGVGALQAIPAAISAGHDVYNSFQYNTTADLLMHQGGTANKEIGGFGYEQYNGPDWHAEMKAVGKLNTANTLKAAGSGAAAGAAIGSIIPGFGTVAGGLIGGAVGLIGGLFGGASRKRKAMEQLRQAEIKANGLTAMGKYSALTDKIRNENAKQIGSSFSPYIHSFHDGKASAFGFVDGKTSAKVSNGETIVGSDGSSFTVPGKPNFKDRVPAIIRNSDAVLSNHGASQYYQMTGDLDGALNMDAMYRFNKYNRYKNGKLPRFVDGGIWANVIPHSLGVLAGVGLYIDADSQQIRIPHTERRNRYATDSLNILRGLDINPYPISSGLRDAEGRTKLAIDSSGGLGAGLRAAARVAALSGTLSNIAKALADVQNQHNAYRAQYANAALLTGTADAQRAQQANQFDEEMTARAHAAKQQGKQMALYNILNPLYSYYNNWMKYNQFKETMDLYRQQLEIDRERVTSDIAAAAQNYINSKNKNSFNPYKQYYIPSTTPMFTVPVRDYSNVRFKLK